MSEAFLRLAPSVERPSLAPDEAVTEAKAAYWDALEANIDALDRVAAVSSLMKPRTVVNYNRLKGMRYEAQRAARHVQRVIESLDHAIDALERAER